MDMQIITKYPNRRIYDTTIGSYITMNDLREYVLQGIDFKIIEKKTNDDLTFDTLLTMVIEKERQTPKLFSADKLIQIIKNDGELCTMTQTK